MKAKCIAIDGRDHVEVELEVVEYPAIPPGVQELRAIEALMALGSIEKAELRLDSAEVVYTDKRRRARSVALYTGKRS